MPAAGRRGFRPGPRGARCSPGGACRPRALALRGRGLLGSSPGAHGRPPQTTSATATPDPELTQLAREKTPSTAPMVPRLTEAAGGGAGGQRWRPLANAAAAPAGNARRASRRGPAHRPRRGPEGSCHWWREKAGPGSRRMKRGGGAKPGLGLSGRRADPADPACNRRGGKPGPRRPGQRESGGLYFFTFCIDWEPIMCQELGYRRARECMA